MRHQLRIPLLSKPADQRKALLRGLTTQLIREGRVTTTKARAKALRNEAERMISLAKEGSLASRRRAIGYIYDKNLVHSLFEKAKERLRMEVVTDGSTSPDDAIAEAANQLIELFQPLATVTMVEEIQEEPEPSPEAQIPLEELNLSVRAYNCLKRAQVNSVSDLMGFSSEDLLEIKNFGSKSADEVIEALERIGISIPQSRTSV